MTHQEYEAKLADLQSQIEELKQTEIEEDNPKPPHPRWMPIFNEIYYFIDEKEVREYIWYGDRRDNALYSVGNVFMTKEAAEFAAECMKVLAEMREWAGSWNDPYAIGYVRLYNQETRVIVNDKLETISHGEMRFKTEEDAYNCLKAVGEERIKKYYFGITE